MATLTGSADWPASVWMGMVVGLLTASVAQAGTAPASPDSAVNPAPAATREWRYRIALHDTLIGLAATYLQNPADWQSLQRHNRVANPRRLEPGSYLRIPFDWLRREAAVAEVVFVQGQVSVQRAAGEAVTVVQPGLRILPADAVRTGPQSSVSLRFADGSRLLIVPDSQVTMEQLLVYGRTGITDTRLRIDRGSADTQVVPNAMKAPAFEVRTPAVNLGVRGTDFRVRVDAAGGASRVEVLEGSVGTGRESAGGATEPPVLVAAGYGTVARQDEPVAPPRHLLPAPAVVPGPLMIRQLPLSLGWTAVDGARGYRAQIFSEGQADALLRDGVFSDTEARWPTDTDLPDGAYRLRVRALDEVGLEGLDGNGRFVLAARPVPPAIELPRPGGVSAGDEVNLRWALVPGVLRYRLQVAEQGDFSRPLRDQSVVGNDTSLALPPGVYQWRVAAVPVDGGAAPSKGTPGPFGTANTFELRPVPALPTLEAPQISPASLLLRWKATAAGQGVLVHLARDSAFVQRLVDQRTWGSQLQIARPAAGSYYLRLRSVIGDAPVGEYSPAMEILVPGIPWWERMWLSSEPASP